MLNQLLVLCVLLATVSGAQPANDSHFTVGTVLFSPADASKECWSPENAALITSRMLIRHAMPNVKTLRANDEKFVVDIIDYFRLMLEVIRSTTTGKTKHIMLLAFTDTLGGYMKHLILPISKYAYYAGSVDYTSIVKLYQLFDELKNYLHTNGNGWAKAWKRAGKHIEAKAIPLQTAAPDTDPCKGIIYYKHGGRMDVRAAPIVPPRTCSMEVPLPFFDSKTHPSAIAVPFKTFGLRNLESRVSAYILVKFYVAVSKCMASRNTIEDDVQKFNGNMYSFIMAKVMPHLCDEKFYAAFGGVLRILETIKQLGNKSGKQIGSFNILPETEEREPYPENSDEGEDIAPGAGHGAGSESKRAKNSLILLAALATIIIWFCLGAAFVCCRVRASKMKRDDNMKALEDAAKGSKESTLDVEICKVESCPAYELSSVSTLPRDYVAEPMGSKLSSTKSSDRSSPSTEMESDTGTRRSVPVDRTAESATSLRRGSSLTKPTELRAPDATTAGKAFRAQSLHYYPPTFACHTSMTGKVKVDSSTDDYTSRDETKRPYVFGYDFQTTSEDSSPRETDGENEMGGNMSK